VVPTIYAYGALVDRVDLHQLGPVFAPSTFYDSSRTLEHKVELWAFTTGEAKRFPTRARVQALRAIAARWGSPLALEAAEPSCS